MNSSGVKPIDMRVLVKPDPVEEVTKGGIFLPDQVKEQEKWAAVKATLIDAGTCAWGEAVARGFIAPLPGARVMIAKYGGKDFKGDDGEWYRMMNDEDVVGILTGGN